MQAGIGRTEDLERFRELSGGRLDFTIGSALDLFGGDIPYDMVREDMVPVDLEQTVQLYHSGKLHSLTA